MTTVVFRKFALNHMLNDTILIMVLGVRLDFIRLNFYFIFLKNESNVVMDTIATYEKGMCDKIIFRLKNALLAINFYDV